MTYLVDLKARVAQILNEKFQAEGVTAFKAEPIFPWAQDRLPYAAIRTGSKTRRRDNEENDLRATRNIIIRLIVANSTEGYKGQAQDKLDDYITFIEEAFETNPDLVTEDETYDEPPVYLDAAGALLTGDTGLVRFSDGGNGEQDKMGVEFTLEVPIEIDYADM